MLKKVKEGKNTGKSEERGMGRSQGWILGKDGFHRADLAHDLAERLLPAFDKTDTGIPFPRVNLRHGLPEVCVV